MAGDGSGMGHGPSPFALAFALSFAFAPLAFAFAHGHGVFNEVSIGIMALVEFLQCLMQPCAAVPEPILAVGCK